MVTTLADLIYATPRRFSYVIKVNGVTLVPSSQATGLNELTGVPGVVGFGWDEATAHIDVNRCPNWMRAGMTVTIDAGFNGLNMRCFTGFIIALPGEDPDYLRDKIIVRGTTIQVGTPPDDVPVEQKATASLVGADIQPPLPSGTHIEHEISVPLVSDPDRLAEIAIRELGRYGVVPRQPSGDPSRQTILCGGELYKAARAYQLDDITLDGFTDLDAMMLICDLVGITKRKFIEPPEGWYTLDVGAKVRRGRPLDMLAQLMVIGGLEAYHSEDGTAVFRQVEFAPGPSHAWEYDVQDQDLARVLNASGELEVTFNPFVRKFSTGLINIPYLGFNSSRVFTRRVRHEATSDGPKTYIDAWGGSRLGGTLEQDPFAAFTFQVDREVMGTAVYLVYSVDASASFDPDGTIASYAWTCNRTTTPSSLPATKIMQFRVAATVTTPLTLTLTVTDADGNTGTLAIDLPTAADATEMQIPAIFAALETRMSATPDGGSNWNDIASLSGDEVSVDAKPADGLQSGIACYGYTDGSIKRTTDFALTSTTVLAADAANGTILEVWWDKNVPTRVWAGCSTGRLLRSNDDGVTWALHKAFASNEPIYRIATPDGSNSVWCFGGRGDDTSTLMRYQFDVGGTGGGTAFVSVPVGGELATALVGAGSSLHVRSAASGQDGELIILLNGAVPAGSQDNIFRTATVFDPAGAGWVAATGLTAGLTDGREIVPDATPGTFRAFFGNQSVWNTADGVAFTETTSVLPAGVTPNRVLWLGAYTGHAGTYLIAAENAGHTLGIYKWLASEATADVLRPATGFATWPASADGRAIAIGAASMTVADRGGLAMILTNASPRTITKLLAGAPSWTTPVSVTGVTAAQPRPFVFTADLMFVANEPNGSDAVGGGLYRSTDGGATWALSLAAGVAVCRAANGWLWAIARTAGPFNQTMIHKSINDGASWTLDETLGTGSSPDREGAFIAAHPTNQNIVAVWGGTETGGGGFLAVTVNATVTSPTWTTSSTSVQKFGQAGINYAGFAILANGRIVTAGFDSGGGLTYNVKTLDPPYTAAWATRYTNSGGGYTYRALGAWGTKVMLVKGYSTPTPDETKIVYSDDSATTFAELACDTLETFTGDATTTNYYAMVYDGVRDRLALATNASGFEVVGLSPVSDEGQWTNLKDSLASTSMAAINLAVIP